jgi:hypothetical protein
LLSRFVRDACSKRSADSKNGDRGSPTFGLDSGGPAVMGRIAL